MPRLTRHLSTAIVAGSLGLCVVTCVLWAVSHGAPGALGYGMPRTAAEVSAMDGYFLFCRVRTTDPTFIGKFMPTGVSFTGGTPAAYRLPAGTITAQFGMAGWNVLRFNSPRGGFTDTIWYAHVPCWQIALLTALPALPRLFALGRDRRRARQAAGLCPACGYDLRGHAPGARCPECGTAATAEAPS